MKMSTKILLPGDLFSLSVKSRTQREKETGTNFLNFSALLVAFTLQDIPEINATLQEAYKVAWREVPVAYARDDNHLRNPASSRSDIYALESLVRLSLAYTLQVLEAVSEAVANRAAEE